MVPLTVVSRASPSLEACNCNLKTVSAGLINEIQVPPKSGVEGFIARFGVSCMTAFLAIDQSSRQRTAPFLQLERPAADDEAEDDAAMLLKLLMERWMSCDRKVHKPCGLHRLLIDSHTRQGNRYFSSRTFSPPREVSSAVPF